MNVNDARFWKGTLYCLLAALVWASIAPASRACFEAGMSPTSVGFWRIAMASVCFLIHAVVRREFKPSLRDAAVIMFFGAVSVSLFVITIQISIQKSGGAMAIILLFTAPAWVALFSRLFFKEQLTGSRLFAMAIAMLGTALVCAAGSSLGTGEFSWLGIFCGLASGFFYGLQFPFFVWWKDKYSTATLFGLSFSAAAIVMSGFAGPLPLENVKGMSALLILGILSSYLAYFLYGLSLRLISQVQAAILGNLEPVAATLLSWWLWDENFSFIGWVGCALVIGSVLLLTVKR
ncbi:EamA family transporter [uncultured Mailhella sp.]|uniref:DMT family transporter n=1 Tax=uncultured Mailhella sp. TaxID=1981031 RepID=UPI002632CC71|nr:EamA family transporter [uncultured Mailhella sp.]